MPTSSRPRRAGVRASAALLATLTATAAALITAPTAVAVGENGDVKIHRVGFPFDNRRNQPTVCDFYLAAFDFETIRKVNWRIDDEPPVVGVEPVASGSISLTNGRGYTPPVMPEGRAQLPNGDYRLTFVIDETPTITTDDEVQPGEGKYKTFNVVCPLVTAALGAPPAGGGGLAMTQDFSPVAGAAAVGLAAVGGVAYLRLRRRRTDGAA
ncbi:hypothetical protein ACWD4G_00775 [Streptomyces sp. NPDC002643]